MARPSLFCGLTERTLWQVSRTPIKAADVEMGKDGWQDAEEYKKVGELMGRLKDESSVAVRLSVV